MAKPIKTTIVDQFNDYWNPANGTETNIQKWQRLCRDLGLDGQFTNYPRKAIATIHVNIYDFIEAVNADTKPRLFESERALADYTLKTRRIYPRNRAKQSGPLRVLLRFITHPRGGKKGGRRK
ncbi:hypothetical protein B0T22DRAFT_477807 [Podospora appendiculata]|uniref:Uncharacterized protein n=1 Tax=Podospora appendiculata TaxID=314037 RepID=A0AAE1CI10_9PEZI|nr:hypothetical protein B0T22DRAFT_477807 [Podospora appendiculata]